MREVLFYLLGIAIVAIALVLAIHCVPIGTLINIGWYLAGGIVLIFFLRLASTANWPGEVPGLPLTWREVGVWIALGALTFFSQGLFVSIEWYTHKYPYDITGGSMPLSTMGIFFGLIILVIVPVVGLIIHFVKRDIFIVTFSLIVAMFLSGGSLLMGGVQRTDEEEASRLPRPANKTISLEIIGSDLRETTAPHKTGPFVIGYLVHTDQYTLATNIEAALGQQGAFGGPATVNKDALARFRSAAEQIVALGKSNQALKVIGYPVVYRDGRPFYLDGKQVVILTKIELSSQQTIKLI